MWRIGSGQNVTGPIVKNSTDCQQIVCDFQSKGVLNLEENSSEFSKFAQCSGQLNELSLHSGNHAFCRKHTFPWNWCRTKSDDKISVGPHGDWIIGFFGIAVASKVSINATVQGKISLGVD